MNKINYFLALVSTAFLFFTFCNFINNQFFPDVGGGYSFATLSSLFFTLLWVVVSLFIFHSRIKYLGRSNYWLVYPIILILGNLGFLVSFFFNPYLDFTIAIFFIRISVIFYGLLFIILPNKSIVQEVSFSYKNGIVFAIITIYISAGFFFLSSPLVKFDYEEPLSPMSPRCYKARYLNIFIFKTTVKRDCRGGI